jgi:hypothetical protein
LLSVAEACRAAANGGAAIRVFFRDESIPAISTDEAAARLGFSSDPAVHEAFAQLALQADTRLYACSSSLYVWNVRAEDLIPAIAGVRGLIAFLADDLTGADDIRSY